MPEYEANELADVFENDSIRTNFKPLPAYLQDERDDNLPAIREYRRYMESRGLNPDTGLALNWAA
jgi:hypothetical protein